MKIYFTPSTAGRSGGWLNGNLRHLDNYINSELNKSGFTSSFDELWLTLSYPPLYVLPGVAGMEKQFMEYYNSFPYTRLNRRYKKIDIILQAPEFSEHFDKEEKVKYKHQFDIDEKYKDITETELAGILIDKYLEALELIKLKLKKEDIFDFKTFEKVLNTIREKITLPFLQAVSLNESNRLHKDSIEHSETNRQQRKKKQTVPDTIIKDLRLYYAYDFPQYLSYLNRYADVVLKHLIEKGFKCPKYHHLYISIGDTKEHAMKEAFVVEDWYTFGVAVLKKEILLAADHTKQQRLVLNAIKEGLLDIAELDKLDKEKILEAIDEAKEADVLSEIIFKAKENNKIAFIISTKTILGQNKEEIYFTIVDKTTSKIARWKFGQENIFVIGGWFGTINVTNKKITVKPRANMDLVLKGKQKIIQIDVEKELLIHAYQENLPDI